VALNGDRDIDKALLTLGVLLTVALVIFAARYDTSLTDWAKVLCGNVFGAWLLALRQYIKNGNGNGNPPNPA
jgi:uncharacterized membrane-anchored protein